MSEERDFLQELTIREVLLNQHLVDHAAQQAYWGVRFAETLRASKIAKLRAEVTQASLITQTMQVMVQAGQKATEMTVMAVVNAHPDRVSAWENAYEAEYQSNMMKAAAEGFTARKDALVTLAANARQEMQGHPKVFTQPRES